MAVVPETSTVALEAPNFGIIIDTWESYSFNSHFLTPTDGWTFTLGDDDLIDQLLLLHPGQLIALSVDGYTQCTGYVDSVQVTHDRSGGTRATISGRDRLAQAVDACIDPRTAFKPGMNFAQFIAQVFDPFGWGDPHANIVDYNSSNRNVLTGQLRGNKTTKNGRPLKSFTLHQLKPNPHEGAFSFAARVAERFGLWIWLSSTGDYLVCARPSYDEPALYTIISKRDGTTNVLSSDVHYDATGQPSVIVATGFGTGGENPHGRLQAIMINELTGLDANGNPTADVAAIVAAWPAAKLVATRGKLKNASKFVSSNARPMYLHDDESKTPEELEYFVRREMALKQKSSLTYTCEVEGHTQNGVIWALDTMTRVDDDFCGVHESLYLVSRTFTKDRHSGTRTRLEFIRPYTLDFGEVA